MDNPKTVLQEVLLTLIVNGEVSLIDFPYLSGFRTRISELKNRYGIVTETYRKKGRNKFGNSYTLVVHKLNKEHREKAWEVYEELQKKNG